MLSPYLPYLSSKKIILASTSPRRRDALNGLGLTFDIVASNFKEDLDKTSFKSGIDYVLETAYLKTMEVYKSYVEEKNNDYDIIIGADSVVLNENEILEKPSNEYESFDMIKKLSGKSHKVVTAVIIIFRSSSSKDPIISKFYDETKVTFSELTDDMIRLYASTNIPLDKAGGYGIQEYICGSFIESIDGCFYNVTGFPLNKFSKELIKLINNENNK